MSEKTINRDSAKFKAFIRDYWNYYKELEAEFCSTRKYVDFQVENFNTYSVEFLKLYQAVCSEIDVIGKAMAVEADTDFKPEDKMNNILKWWYFIQNKYVVKGQYSDIDGDGVALKDVRLLMADECELQPWERFSTEEYFDSKNHKRYRTINSSTPEWWSDYNAVKHARTFLDQNSDKTNYTKANLGNLSKALAALHVLEKAYMQAIGTKDDLEAFADYSLLFDKVANITTSEIEKALEETFADKS